MDPKIWCGVCCVCLLRKRVGPRPKPRLFWSIFKGQTVAAVGQHASKSREVHCRNHAGGQCPAGQKVLLALREVMACYRFQRFHWDLDRCPLDWGPYEQTKCGVSCAMNYPSTIIPSLPNCPFQSSHRPTCGSRVQ